MELSEIKVIKRDGREVEYDESKVKNAIHNALLDVIIKGNLEDVYLKDDLISFAEMEADDVTCTIINSEKEFWEVEEIQDIVKIQLISKSSENPLFVSVAKSYIEYSTTRLNAREWEKSLVENIQKLLNKDDTVMNENANKDSRIFNTLRDLTAGSVAKSIGLNMLPTRVRESHIKGEVYQHDLDYFPYSPMTNCSLPDFEFMLKNGFSLGNAQLNSPKSIQTAVAHIIQIIGALASSQYGGISIHNVDSLLIPYAKMNYDKHIQDCEKYNIPNKEVYAKEKTTKDIYDSMQSLEFEINTLNSSTGQSPFLSVGFGRTTDFFGREIQKAIFKVRMKKMNGRLAIFPKLIFFHEEGINKEKDSPNYDIKQLALKCASVSMYPDIINVKRIKEVTGGIPTPMGCRSLLPQWINQKTGEEEYYGRMNLGVVTINLPRIGLESNGVEDKFWEILEERIEIAKEGLLYRLKRIREATPDNAPVLYREGAFGKRLSENDNIDSLFFNKRATLSLGYIGIYEATSCIYGLDWEKNKEAKDFSVNILKKMKKHVDEWKEEYDIWFSIYATPSEALTHKFNIIDTEEFGEIKGITDKDWYTNSFHYEVEKSPNPFEKLDFESEYEPYTSGGFIHYTELVNVKHNLKALEDIWDYSYDKIGYLGQNIPVDKCFECGFEGEFNATEHGYKCSTCGNTNPDTADVVKRLCGYLGNPLKRPVIHGRHKEMTNRKKHG